MAGKCEECGCVCAKCTKNNEKHTDMHLHAEIENLRQRLIERDSHIVTMETQFLSEADKFPNGELASMREESLIWQEKYSRLCEAHKRVQKVNQNLEDKLLRIVDKCETEKGAFAKDIATLSHRLADANYTIHRLTQDNEKYRNDVNLAIQLLQCKPSNFVGQKYDSLPSEVQAKVRTYVAQKRRSSDALPPDVKSITVPISTFPPTAMVYNITKSTAEKHSDDDESDDSKPPVDIVSAAIMAKVLEDRERERIFAKHCDTCTCHRTILMIDSETQTSLDRYDARVYDEFHKIESPLDPDNVEKFDNAATNDPRPPVVETTTNGQGTFRRVVGETKISRGRMEISSNDNFIGVAAKIGTRQVSAMHGQHATKQKSLRTCSSERAPIMPKCAVVGRSKQARSSKKNDTDETTRGCYNSAIPENWNKFEEKRGYEMRNVADAKELSRADMINDRIWKSGRNAAGLFDTFDGEKDSADKEFDVINDRAWRNDRIHGNNDKTRMTLIEVTNSVESTIVKDFGQPEVAISPSFSSDSVVISTSNQSSSSSDALHIINDKRILNNNNNNNNNNNSNNNSNNNNTRSSWKSERASGPRNCFMRVTPGSKNILLDNAGHYQTVLYTSGANKPNTALVHLAKSIRSGRSCSTSSEENSPMVTSADSNQLRRVAEWVQSSVGAAGKNEQKTPKSLNMREKIGRKKASMSDEISKNDENLVEIDTDENREIANPLLVGAAADANLEEIIVQTGDKKFLDNPFIDVSRDIENEAKRRVRETPPDEPDLISFENCNADDGSLENLGGSCDNADPNYEVKITKEMEEIYLKLAASLDPVSLRLAGSSGADLTIENYRKDHRRINVQKQLRDKPESSMNTEA